MWYSDLLSIWINDSPNSDILAKYTPKDLSKHYKGEIKNCSLDGIYVATQYRDIQASLEAYKYRSDRQFVSPFVEILSKILQDSLDINREKRTVIVPIPMHWTRYAFRGYDHMKILAKELGKNEDIGVFSLLKSRWSFRQSKLLKKDRIKNRESVFAMIENAPLYDTVILLDDVISSGATVHMAGLILKEFGVKRVYALCIASNQ